MDHVNKILLIDSTFLISFGILYLATNRGAVNIDGVSNSDSNQEMYFFPVPQLLKTLETIKQISCGADHTLAFGVSGDPIAWCIYYIRLLSSIFHVTQELGHGAVDLEVSLD